MDAWKECKRMIRLLQGLQIDMECSQMLNHKTPSWPDWTNVKRQIQMLKGYKLVKKGE